jgi:hypothetical protein
MPQGYARCRANKAYTALPTGKGFGVRDREFTLFLNKLFLQTEKTGNSFYGLPVFFVFSDYLDSETLVELPTLEPDVVLLPQAVAIAATIATTATKAKIFFMSLISLQ